MIRPARTNLQLVVLLLTAAAWTLPTLDAQEETHLLVKDTDRPLPPMPEAVAQSVESTAQENVLTLGQLHEMALANNPTIRQAGELLERARGKWDQAGRYPNPVVGYSASEIGNNGKAGQQGAFIS